MSSDDERENKGWWWRRQRRNDIYYICRWTQPDGEIGLQAFDCEHGIIQSEIKSWVKGEAGFRAKIQSLDIYAELRVLNKIDKFFNPIKLRVLWDGKNEQLTYYTN